jgi:hypothetical protein
MCAYTAASIYIVFFGTIFYKVKASNDKSATRGHPGHRTSLSHIRCLSSTKLFLYKKILLFGRGGSPPVFSSPSHPHPEISDSLTLQNRWRYIHLPNLTSPQHICTPLRVFLTAPSNNMFVSTNWFLKATCTTDIIIN